MLITAFKMHQSHVSVYNYSNLKITLSTALSCSIPARYIV